MKIYKEKSKSKNKYKTPLRIAIYFALTLLLCVFLGGAYIYFGYTNAIVTPNSDSKESVTFVIEYGETSVKTAEKLVSEGILHNKHEQYFLLYLRINDLSSKIQAGTYNIPKNLTIPEIIETIQTGSIKEVWIQIPEGVDKKRTAEVIDEKLNQYGLHCFSSEEFLRLTTDAEFIESLPITLTKNTDTSNKAITDLEGLLFPDKYLVSVESDEKTMITLLVNTFISKTTDLKMNHEDLIIASMLEREGVVYKDRQIISGIIRKRWQEGWFLGIDATILFYKGDWQYKITREDIEENHPYNTYTRLGLPPGPICNPTLSSLQASVNPVKTEFYYYIHDTDGSPHYAENLSQHNANIREYLSN